MSDGIDRRTRRPAGRRQTSGTDLNGKHHLAEDYPSLRTFLAKALGKADHMVTSREDAVEAIAALEPRDYDLLLAEIY